MILKKKRIIFIRIVLFVSLIIAFICYVVFTTRGSSFLFKSFLLRHLDSKENIKVVAVRGSLFTGLVYQDLELDNLSRFPDGSLIKIERLNIRLESFGLGGLDIRIQNGRIFLSDSEAALFYGSYKKGLLDFTIYSKAVNVRSILDLIPDFAELRSISGVLSNLDIQVKGTLSKPKVLGSFNIDKLARERFSVVDCPVELSLNFKDLKGGLKIKGQILLKSGVVSGFKTAAINLKESWIIYEKDPKKPILDLSAGAVVENVEINISLKGEINNLWLQLASIPQIDQERLMLMLATNRKWESLDTALSRQELSADVIKDFLYYFLFPRSESNIFKRYGIDDISLEYDGKTAGIKAKKDITDKTAIGYSIEQVRERGEDTAVSHTLSGEYKITENVTIGVEKELKQDDKDSGTESKEQPEGKAMLKFKKEF
jgi:autotransporter translocation and assembly factor TamB